MVRRFDPNAEIEIVTNNKVRIKVDKEFIPRIIGKGGATVSELEQIIGMKIDIEAKTAVLGNTVDYQINESGSSILFIVNKKEIGANVGIYVDNEFLFSSQIGKKARIKIDKRSEYGKKLLNAILTSTEIKLFKTN